MSSIYFGFCKAYINQTTSTTHVQEIYYSPKLTNIITSPMMININYQLHILELIMILLNGKFWLHTYIYTQQKKHLYPQSKDPNCVYTRTIFSCKIFPSDIKSYPRKQWFYLIQPKLASMCLHAGKCVWFFTLAC